MRKILLVVAVLLVSGCTSLLGLNFQRSALRSSGDLASTIELEYCSVGAVEQEKASIIKYAKEALAFVDTGKIRDLPVDEVEKALKKIVPPEFSIFVDAAMGYIDSIDVDIDGKIGKDNVKRLKAFLCGVIAGAGHYDVKDRTLE